MPVPPYHLRLNKAVDRALLVDAFRTVVPAAADRAQYAYIGFGGPFLEDFRLFHEAFPELTLISLERSASAFARQNFHIPCSKLDLRNEEMSDLLDRGELENMRCVVWLDYTGIELENIEEYVRVIQQVAPGSLVKISVQCHPSHWDSAARKKDFKETFDAYLPGGFSEVPGTAMAMATMLSKMMAVAAEEGAPPSGDVRFLHICSSYYRDGVGMLSVSGLVVNEGLLGTMKARLEPWQFYRGGWADPKQIDVPILTTKERLKVQSLLPIGKNAGSALRRELGYNLDEGNAKATEVRLAQYAEYYVQLPYFMKAVP